jgi:hypothetical protein
MEDHMGARSANLGGNSLHLTASFKSAAASSCPLPVTPPAAAVKWVIPTDTTSNSINLCSGNQVVEQVCSGSNAIGGGDEWSYLAGVESLQGSNDYLGKYLGPGQAAPDAAATDLLAHLNKVLSAAEAAVPPGHTQVDGGPGSAAGAVVRIEIEPEDGCMTGDKATMQCSSLSNSCTLVKLSVCDS